MLQALFGNASEVDPKNLQRDLNAILCEGEQVVKAFRVLRDLFIFTDKRLVLVDKQGLTGSKVEYHSIPYYAITHFAVESPGTFDLDSEVKIYITGEPTPIVREFKRGTDITGFQKALAQFVLK